MRIGLRSIEEVGVVAGGDPAVEVMLAGEGEGEGEGLGQGRDWPRAMLTSEQKFSQRGEKGVTSYMLWSSIAARPKRSCGLLLEAESQGHRVV